MLCGRNPKHLLPSAAACSFHATVEAHERGAEQHAEDELQLEQQYAAAQEGGCCA